MRTPQLFRIQWLDTVIDSYDHFLSLSDKGDVGVHNAGVRATSRSCLYYFPANLITWKAGS